MKQIWEEYYGTLENGDCGKIFYENNSAEETSKIILSSTEPIYGHRVGSYIYLIDIKGKKYSEEDLHKAGFSRLVRMNKVIRTIEQEKIWEL